MPELPDLVHIEKVLRAAALRPACADTASASPWTSPDPPMAQVPSPTRMSSRSVRVIG